MASQSYSTLGFSLLQELGSNEIIKRNRAYLVIPGGRKHEIIQKSSSFNVKAEHLKLKPLKTFCSLTKSDSTMMKPRLIGVHETRPEPLCSSLGIKEQYARQAKLIEFLLSKSEELKKAGFDMSLLSVLMGLQALRSSSQLQQDASSSVLNLNQESAKPLSDVMVDGGNILFPNSSRAEFHKSKNSTRWRKLSRLVPQFQRSDSEALIDTLQLNTANLDAATLASPQSPEKTRLKPSPKKKNPKIRDREPYLFDDRQ